MQRKWRRAWLRGKPSFMKTHLVHKLHKKTLTAKACDLATSTVKKLMPAAAAAGIFLSAMTGVQANPIGGSIAAGTGSINGQGTNNVTVNQTSDKLSINWNSFSIASGEKVQFIQPGTSSIALNRVLGNNASAIYGQLSANGQVFLINPNGVLFAKSAAVSVGGLVASTLNLSDNDFFNGKYTFSGTSPNGVRNKGNITAANGGYVALLGANAANEGIIVAQQGTVAMGAGSKVSLDFTGDGLLTLAVDERSVNAEVQNSGLIKADGGLVVMNAKAADALTGSVVNNTGTIEAKSVMSKNGTIILTGDSVTNAGILDASGKNTGESGGTVKVLGDTVKLASGSTIDVSGDSGGGTALVGGTYQGGDSEYAATTTTVENGTSINADAKNTGNGGQVVVWANDTTKFAGSISAKGGSNSGDGGSVETSGHKTLMVANTASVNTTAAKGKTGNWLLDPEDYTVGTDVTGTNYWNNNALQTALGSSNITITTNNASGTGNGDINILAPVSWSANKLALSAYRNINIKNILSATGSSSLDMTSSIGGTGTINYGLTASGFIGKVNFDRSGSGFLTINGQAYTVITSLGSSGSITGTDLQGISGNLGGNYFLGGDIDASATKIWNYVSGSGDSAIYEGFTPIGNGPTTPFDGTFDGGGHTISDLTINSSAANVGLFGFAGFSSKISNTGLVGASVTGSNAYVGGLVGADFGSIANSYNTGSVKGLGASSGIGGLAGSIGGSITDSYNTGSVKGEGDNSYVGGLTGSINNGSITGSYNTGSVTGTGTTSYVGGLTGFNTHASITGSYNTGSATSTYAAGGLVGYNLNHGSVMGSYNTGSVIGTRNSFYAGGLVSFQDDSGSIENAYNTGSVTGSRCVGGLVGYQTNSSIKNVYNTGSVTGIDKVGGLVGENNGSLSNSYSTGSVSGSGTYAVGGLVGLNTSSISNSYSTGSVSGSGSGTYAVGGLVGRALGGSISNSYSIGSVSGSSGSTGVGGLVGSTTGTDISNSYSTGFVSGYDNVGGLVGFIDGGSISYSYWDVNTSGQTKGVGNEETVSSATGTTTAALMAALPTGFDSSIWDIIGGTSYPYLKWRYPVTPQVVSGILNNTSDYSGKTVAAAANGSLLASTTTGANGFYYFLFDNNTIANGTSLLTYVDNGSVKANTVKFIKGTNTSVSYLILAGGYVQVYGGDAAGDGALDVNALLVSAKGSLTDSDILYTASGGSIAVNGGLSVYTNFVPVTVSNAISASGNIYLLPKGDIILAGTGSVTSTGGDAFLASANGHFINHNTAATAVSAANGRRLIYSVSPVGNMYGNLSYDFSQYNTSFGGPMNILGEGNGFIYQSALALSAALTGTVTKPYDGKTATNIQASNLSIDTGSLSGATATYTGSGLSAAYNSKNVTEANMVTISDPSVANAQITQNSSLLDRNQKSVYGYTVSLTNTSTAGTISQRQLTAAATAADKVYDGNTDAVVTGVTFGNLVYGESLTAAYNTVGTFADKNTGNNIKVTVSGVTMTANNAHTSTDNYLLPAEVTTTAAIKPATVTDPGYIAAVRSTQQNTESNIAENGANPAPASAAHGTPQQMPAGQVCPIQYDGDNTGARRVITITEQTVTIAKDSPVQLATNPIQKEIAVYQTINGSTTLAAAYHVDGSESSLALRESATSFAPVSPEMPAPTSAQAETSSYQLTDSQGNTANFTISYIGGGLYVQAANAAAADMLSQNRQLITAASLVAAQDKLSIDIQDLKAVCLEQ